jgi:hypothetical protein
MLHSIRPSWQLADAKRFIQQMVGDGKVLAQKICDTCESTTDEPPLGAHCSQPLTSRRAGSRISKKERGGAFRCMEYETEAREASLLRHSPGR